MMNRLFITAVLTAGFAVIVNITLSQHIMIPAVIGSVVGSFWACNEYSAEIEP